MTAEQILAKNNRIRKQERQTREIRKYQICLVYRVEIDFYHLNEAQRVYMKMLFAQAKWLCNDALTFSHEHDINNYDTIIHTVHGLDNLPVTRELEYLAPQMKQSVIQGIKHSLKGLAALKKRNHTVGSLHYKSDYESINLHQYRVIYKSYDMNHPWLQRTYTDKMG